MSRYSTNGGWLLTLLRTLHDAGVDHCEVLAGQGLTFEQVKRGNLRLSVEQMTALWHVAARATGDPAIGLRVAGNVRPTTFGPLSVAMYAAPDVKAALDVLSRYGSIFSDIAAWWTRLTDDGMELITMVRGPVSNEVVDAGLAGMLKILRDISAPDLVPTVVQLNRDAPRDPELWAAVFGTTVTFKRGAPSLLRLPKPALSGPLFGHNAELYEVCVGLMEAELARLRRGPMTSFTKAQITIGLPDQEAGIEDVAANLGVSAQTLRRRLKDEGQVFSELHDQVRREFAQRYLEESALPMTDISEMLGFRTLSSFSRACRRWFGRSPSRVRSAVGKRVT